MTHTDLFKTYKDVFDESAINAIWYLITHKKIEGLESPLKIGKESNIFSALTKKNKRLAVKIYRVNTGDFFKMSHYLSMDTRFRRVERKKQVILVWAKREYSNLMRAYKAGVNVPRPIAINENVLVMEFIGSEFPHSPQPYPLLKDSKIDQELFEKLKKELKKLYKAGLAHGDLSEFNILNKDGEPIIIDLSHATPLRAPAAKELLERDIKNICIFFNKKGVSIKEEELLDYIRN